MKRKRQAYEIFIVAACVLLALFMAGALCAGRSNAQKTELMQQELGALRRAILAYRLDHQSNPPSLEALSESPPADEGGDVSAPYLNPLPGEREGQAVDPFGNPYLYDSGSGWVSSSSKGFERW